MTRKEMIEYVLKNTDAHNAHEAELILNRLDFDYDLVSCNQRQGYFLRRPLESYAVQNALDEIQEDL